MYLSRLEVLGFKSFARKTKIDFHDGITAIVGPNGCGKSNVVDAIRWVLGEQRAGLLRSENMQNVIFNGTRTQKPLGMAEVSLTIQNIHSVLPIEYSEVVITRRLFRSGESQYLLNQSPCRLKDVIDLFMDTGMGSNAYSIIELSMVEKILNGKPEERRQIFEEAAGVTKYKIRRRAAFRKLEATEQDLIRLSDIISEVEKTTNSLRRQVNKATRYRDMSRELRQLELDYSAYSYAKIQQELNPLEARSKETTDRKEKISAELATKEAEVEKKQVKIIELERQLNSRGSNLSANRQRIREKEEEILVCQERVKALKTAQERANNEIDELLQRAAGIVDEKSEVAERLHKLRGQLTETESELHEARATLGEIQTNYGDRRAAGKGLESSRLNLIEEIASIQKNEERLRAHLAFSDGRIKTIENESARLDLQIKEIAGKEKELSEQRQIYRDQADELDEELATATRDLELARENVEKCRAALMQMQGEITTRQDRADLLRKVLESYEDYPEGVRYLMREKERTSGFHGTLGDLLSVDDKYRTAIESALGDSAVAVIVDSALDAVQAMETLKSEQKGAVTFLPIDNFTGNGATHKNAVQDVPGVIGWASDIVKIKPPFIDIVTGLLSKALVVDELNTALEMAPRYKGRQVSIVTQDGEIVHAWGGLHGGQSGDAAMQKLGRKAAVEKLLKEITELESKLSEEQDILEKHNNRVRELTATAESLKEKKKRINATLQKVEIACGQAEGELRRTEDRKNELLDEQNTLAGQLTGVHDELAAIHPSLEMLDSKKATVDAEYREFQNTLSSLEEKLKEKEEKAQAVQLDFVKIQADVSRAEHDLERLSQTAAEVETAINRRKEEIRTMQKQAEELEQRVKTFREDLQGDFAERKELEDVLAEINQSHRAIKEEIEAQEKGVKGVRAQRDELFDSLHKMELRISELKMNSANLVEQMQENYETDLRKYPAPEEIDTDAAAERINVLKQKIRAMGPVNMLALKDYEVEKERLDFLLAQKADLLEAEDNLKETIRVINNNAYERFRVVFSKVRENFIQVFQSFFENGNADLRLADEDPLEAEILIEASPKGKKLGSLALLSGGEKTLTAISLLFAIYLVKPSPFCVLDEVDAPLDDANIGRFSNALEKFSDRTQFIVVTHNKLTMNAAKQLYGVTMEEPGVSKIVSVKFEEVEQENTQQDVSAEQASI